METTVSKLERQIEERLKGVSEYESININHRLGKLLIHMIFQMLPSSMPHN